MEQDNHKISISKKISLALQKGRNRNCSLPVFNKFENNIFFTKTNKGFTSTTLVFVEMRNVFSMKTWSHFA
jgi:hypothetical protein